MIVLGAMAEGQTRPRHSVAPLGAGWQTDPVSPTLSPRMAASERINLVLVYLPSVLDADDYAQIAGHVRAISERVDVHIHEDRAPEPGLVDRLSTHRTLVFSPTRLQAFFVSRGRVFAGRPMPKSEQMLRLELAGLPVPAWSMLDRGKRFDPAHWGKYVVIKPEVGSAARGVEIIETARLNEMVPRLEPYRRTRNNLIIQKLVRNPRYGKIRIQTLFDEVLFARRFRFPAPARFDTENDLRNYERLFVTAGSEAEDFDSPAVFDLAREAHRKFDDVPMLALDVLLDEHDQPFFIEANPGGNTWHFSSALRGRMLRARGTFLERQFGGFERAAEALARRALELAV